MRNLAVHQVNHLLVTSLDTVRPSLLLKPSRDRLLSGAILGDAVGAI